ncbi:unknown [Bacteroides sp. CAG:598]|nr:unknown [Bacteroides sp. CAG:598]
MENRMRGHEFSILHFFISPRNALAFLPLCANFAVSKTKIWNSRWYKF